LKAAVSIKLNPKEEKANTPRGAVAGKKKRETGVINPDIEEILPNVDTEKVLGKYGGNSFPKEEGNTIITGEGKKGKKKLCRKSGAWGGGCTVPPAGKGVVQISKRKKKKGLADRSKYGGKKKRRTHRRKKMLKKTGIVLL